MTAKESGQARSLYETLNELSYEFKYDWAKEGLPNSENVTQEFLEKVVEIAKKLEIDPDDLLAVMAFESRFNPNEKNKGLDKDGKGYITKGDAVQAVLDRREEYIYE